ncbi:MAG: hypothetical protein LQ347_005547 [Umbilicaria vellea]|nr:MAG: hypothetical protein LQ347_005547 [Umbilicaria vellea]
MTNTSVDYPTRLRRTLHLVNVRRGLAPLSMCFGVQFLILSLIRIFQVQRTVHFLNEIIAEYNTSQGTIHDIERRLLAVASTPPLYSFDDTWFQPNLRDAELRKLEGLRVKMAPLTDRQRALLKQVSVGVDVQNVDTESELILWITEWEIAVTRNERAERAESELSAKDTIRDEETEEADPDEEDNEEEGDENKEVEEHKEGMIQESEKK